MGTKRCCGLVELAKLENSKATALRHTFEQVQKDSKLDCATIADEVYEALRILIVTGALEPGEILDQHQIAGILNISRTPLRQALAYLSQDGLIVSQPRRSAQVSQLSRAEARELYALRSVIEPLVGLDAAKRLKKVDLKTLKDLNKSMREAIEGYNYDIFVSLDRKFHKLYYSRSRYVRGANYIEKLRNASDRYIHAFAVHSAQSLNSVIQHDEILTATVRREFDQIESLIYDHVMGGAETLLDLID